MDSMKIEFYTITDIFPLPDFSRVRAHTGGLLIILQPQAPATKIGKERAVR
jgi:hypothetical protein